MIGILLAAGRGTRFDPEGVHNKLMQPLADGMSIAGHAAQNLLAVLPSVIAVVRPGQDALAAQLESLGCRVSICINAGQGMAASLVHGLSLAPDAKGWLIALGDMPYIKPHTIASLSRAIEQGAGIAVPTCHGRRGNPVAFSGTYRAELMRLSGDEGARRLLRSYPVTEVATSDEGILRDIDTPGDLRGPAAAG